MRFEGAALRLADSVEPATRRLLMFHHAGGSALSFVELISELPPWVECLCFELPGRGFRSDEPFDPDFVTAASRLLPDVEKATDRPVVFFGHSLGGLLAHWLACALPEERRANIARVVMSGARHPESVAAERATGAIRTTGRDRKSLEDILRTLGGTPRELMGDQEILDVLVRVLGQDLQLLDTYERPDTSPLVPVEAWAGDADPAVAATDIAQWRQATNPTAEHVRVFRGGHFYLFGDPAVRRELERVMRG
jgi:surfactin synthase thioesterase subunit